MKMSITINGHSTEMVYDQYGNLVTNTTNGGTHNYGDDFIDHFLFDMLPYYGYGTGNDDPTEWWERLTASYPYDPNFTPTQRKIWEERIRERAEQQLEDLGPIEGA